jgi:hypothetical protein
MIQLLGPVIGLASSALEGWQDSKKQKTAIKAAQAEAQIKRIERAAEADADYDLEALRQTQYSWKDEYIVIVLTAPFIASFIPGVQHHVLAGWEYVQQAPDWYQYSFMGAVAASLGIRWAFKFFGGNK